MVGTSGQRGLRAALNTASRRILPCSSQGVNPVEFTPAMICLVAIASIWSVVPL